MSSPCTSRAKTSARPSPPRTQLWVKRAIDLAGSATLLAVLSPVMIAIGFVVRATSPGEVIFRQRRAGRGGTLFTIYKFRTMIRDAPSAPSTYVERDDPRITRVGRFLRAASLDELPQLVNVLKGDMSFVGPRPDLPHHVERYTEAQRRRLEMRPGVTGWAQVNGRNSISWEERIALDLEYVDGWSLRRDLAIVLRTVRVVLSGKGAALPRRAGEGGEGWQGKDRRTG